MTTKDAFQEATKAHIQELYDSIELHDSHLQSTEAVSLESHQQAFKEIEEKRRNLAEHFADIGLHQDRAWYDIREEIDEAIEGLKHAFNRTRDNS